MSANDDRRNSTAANVVDGIVFGLQVVFEWGWFLVEGAVSLLLAANIRFTTGSSSG